MGSAKKNAAKRKRGEQAQNRNQVVPRGRDSELLLRVGFLLGFVVDLRALVPG